MLEYTSILRDFKKTTKFWPSFRSEGQTMCCECGSVYSEPCECGVKVTVALEVCFMEKQHIAVHFYIWRMGWAGIRVELTAK